MSMTSEATQPSPTRAVRLIFEYEGDRVRLVSEHPVDMAITGFDLPQELTPGYYVESRDAANRTMARVPARDAFGTSVEVFPEHPDEPITRVDVDRPKGAFTVVVPVSDAADHVTIVRIAPAATRAPAPPEMIDLASFPLKTGK